MSAMSTKKYNFSLNESETASLSLSGSLAYLSSYRDKGHLSTSRSVDGVSDAINVDSAASMPDLFSIAAIIYHYHHFMSLINGTLHE